MFLHPDCARLFMPQNALPPMNFPYKKIRNTRTIPGCWPGAVIATCLLIACGCAHARMPDTGHPTVGQPTIDALLGQARAHDNATQAILVTADTADAPRATLVTYAYASGHWTKVIGPLPAVLGKNGISLHKREGDGKSPAGIFRIGRAFGSHARPDGIKLPYTEPRSTTTGSMPSARPITTTGKRTSATRTSTGSPSSAC